MPPETIKFENVQFDNREVEKKESHQERVTWCRITFKVIAPTLSKTRTAIGEGRDDREATLAAIEDINFLCKQMK